MGSFLLSGKKLFFLDISKAFDKVWHKGLKQRVILNGQPFLWAGSEVDVSQVCMLEALSTTVKLFADDPSLFPIVKNVITCTSHLNSDLSKTSDWPFQWEMSFDPDPSKQAQEVTFSHKIRKTCYPSIYFYNKSVKQVPSQKHLPMIIDTKLNFQEHFKKNKLNKVNKTIGLLRKLQNILPCRPPSKIQKSFIRPHLECGDAIYD